MDLKQQLVDFIDHITEAKTEKVVLAIITALIIGFYGGRDSMKNHDYKKFR
jgi:hypothetical protein